MLLGNTYIILTVPFLSYTQAYEMSSLACPVVSGKLKNRAKIFLSIWWGPPEMAERWGPLGNCHPAPCLLRPCPPPHIEPEGRFQNWRGQIPFTSDKYAWYVLRSWIIYILTSKSTSGRWRPKRWRRLLGHLVNRIFRRRKQFLLTSAGLFALLFMYFSIRMVREKMERQRADRGIVELPNDEESTKVVKNKW